MSRTVFESVPVTTEIELRLRRVEERTTRIEAALHAGAVPTPVRPVMVAEVVADGLSTVGSDLRDAVHRRPEKKHNGRTP